MSSTFHRHLLYRGMQRISRDSCGCSTYNTITRSTFLINSKRNSKLRSLYRNRSFTVSSGEKKNAEDLWEKNTHIPVMIKEVLDIIKPEKEQVILDMTFGGGGHTKALLGCQPDVTVFALDRDPDAHEQAKLLAQDMPNVVPILGRFSEVHKFLEKHDVGPNSVDAVLFDVGSSSLQFDLAERGFSLSKDGPLDMRMDKHRYPDQPSAADVVNHLDEAGLYKIIKKYGEETKARYIARAIVDSRYTFGKITTTKQFAAVVESAFQGSHKRDKLMRHSHVATKTFQAIRTFVNNELNELHNGLEIVHQLLKPGGVCVAIGFHSLEDRIIKRLFHGINVDDKINMTIRDKFKKVVYCDEDIKLLLRNKWEPISRKALSPTEDEVNRNPRARSAKLRAAKKKSSFEYSL